MNYKVLGQLKVEESGDPDTYSYEYNDINQAVDFYRDCFVNMAETIADFGGNFTVTLVSIDDKDQATLLKRNVISTTINEINHE